MLPALIHFWPFLRLVAVLILTGLSVCCLLVLFLAVGLLTPPRMRDARALFFLRRLSPSDLDLPYRDMNFTVRDHRTHLPLRLTGWWIESPIPSNRTIILIHGYSDSKIGALAWAPLFHALHYNVLAVDQRAHGESQGRFTTAGFYERHDFSQLIDQFKLDQPHQTRHIVLLGISLGAAAAAATAILRSDISAVILECPFKDFPSAALSHARNLPIPTPYLHSQSLRVAAFLARADFGDIRPVDLIRTLRCPIWVIQSTDDPFVPPSDQDAISDALATRAPNLPPAHFWRVQGSYHVLALADHPAEYKRRLTDFLDSALAEEPPQALPQGSPAKSMN